MLYQVHVSTPIQAKHWSYSIIQTVVQPLTVIGEDIPGNSSLDTSGKHMHKLGQDLRLLKVKLLLQQRINIANVIPSLLRNMPGHIVINLQHIAKMFHHWIRVNTKLQILLSIKHLALIDHGL